MTENKIKALLTIAKNLAEINEKIRVEILKNLDVTNDDILNKLLSINADMSIETIMKYLNDFKHFKNTNIDSGEIIMPPEISLDLNTLMFTIAIDAENNNDKIIISNGSADLPSIQAAITYRYAKTNDEIDIAYAEIKKGEIAKAFSLPKNNKNIEVYMFDDPSTESATIAKTINYTEIQNALD